MKNLLRSDKLLKFLETQLSVCTATAKNAAMHGNIVRALYVLVFAVFLFSTARVIRQIWINGGTTTLVKVSNGEAGDVRAQTEETK